MSYEFIRSNHIGGLLDIGESDKGEERWIDRQMLKDTNWEEWKEQTERQFGDWVRNNMDNNWETIDHALSSFMDVFEACRDASVPKKRVRVNGRRTIPPWMCEEVREAIHQLNMANKSFKRRMTDQIHDKLTEAKRRCEGEEEKAKERWVEGVCLKLNTASNPKKLWDCFRQLTSYQVREGGEVLPLVNDKNEPVFDREEKSRMLQQTFFSGEHLGHGEINEAFRMDIADRVKKLDERNIEETEKFDTSYLEEIVSLEETTAALIFLVKGKATGPDQVSTDLVLCAGDNMVTAIHKLFKASYERGEIPREWKTAEVKFLRKPGTNLTTPHRHIDLLA
jgi:hypothetical protein